jgi:hypothetical protein
LARRSWKSDVAPSKHNGSFTIGGLVAKKTELVAKKAALDTTSGQKHFEAIKGEVLALKDADLLQPNVDLEKLAMATLSIVDRANEPALRERFDALPREEFAKGTIEALERAAQATLHVAIKVRTESAGTTKVRVDPALMQEAIEKRETMLRVIAYNLSHLASVMADAEDIRAGTGYLDAASDLSRTSAIYTEHAADLAGDTKFYDPADAAEAVRIAGQIRAAFRASTNQSELWADFAPRVFTHLTRLYKEVQETAHWLLRGDPAARDQFPAIRTAIGISNKRKKGKDGEEGEGNGEGSPARPAGPTD